MGKALISEKKLTQVAMQKNLMQWFQCTICWNIVRTIQKTSGSFWHYCRDEKNYTFTDCELFKSKLKFTSDTKNEGKKECRNSSTFQISK